MKKYKESIVGFLLGFLFLPIFAGKQIIAPQSLEDLVKDAEKNEKPDGNRGGTSGWPKANKQ
jgi:hypothetical protein